MNTAESHRHWLQTRLGLLERVKSRVHTQIGPTPKEMQPYVEAYKKEFRGAWKNSDKDELFSAIEKAQIVIGGDFHAFSQAQRTHLRLLRQLPKSRSVILALECIESRYQKEIDAFLKGRLTEKKFLKSVKWEEHWGFPWEFYKPIFDLAKSKKIKIVGLNRYFTHRTTMTLKKRDKHSAKKIIEINKANPEALIYTIYGDLHLAAPHLPKELKALKSVKIFQNSELLYFRLAKKGLENKVHILKNNNNRFCVLGSPPWVKWQSYQLFLEQSFDASLNEFDGLDFTDHIQEIIQFVSSDLKIKVRGQDFSVYTAGHESIWKALKRASKGKALSYAEEFIKNNESFYLAKSKLMYLSQPTINHAAHLVGQYLQAHLSSRTENLWTVPKNFDGLIWIEACGYLISKMVNHRRKTESMTQLRIRLEKVSEKEYVHEVLLLVLEHEMRCVMDRKGKKPLKPKLIPKKKEAYFSAAQILGNRLGESLYKQYRARGRDRKLVLNYLKQDVNHKNFRKFFLSTVAAI